VQVDAALLSDHRQLEGVVTELHRRWSSRIPTVIELAVDDGELSQPETDRRPAWELGGEFTFLRERLLFLLWNNSYDARHDPPRWWWDVKSRRIGAVPGDDCDIQLPDGRQAWVDGGPRGPLDLDEPVISYESVLIGSSRPARPDRADPPDDLAADQLEAVGHGAGPARIIAPAGSGKTRVLTGRARYLIGARHIEPELVCAVAYNRRAAREMADRLADVEGLQIRTIHSLGWEILQMARGPLTLLSERDVRRRIESMVQTAHRPNTDSIGPYLEALSEIRIAFRDPAAVEASRDDVPDLARLVPRFRQRLAERSEADHDEQIVGAIEALLADPELRRHWQQRCRHMLVDEFQDLTPAYLLLIRLLASPALDVFGVGDDDQVIYGYAGADPRYLIEFERLFPGAASHPLEINYRCPVPVVEGASNLLRYNQLRVEKTIQASPRALDEPGALQVATRHETDMARAAAHAISEWIDAGIQPSDVAVLTRVNSSLLPVQAALTEAGIPLIGALGPSLLERTLMRSTLAWIRIALDPARMSRADILETIRRPSRGLNRLARDVLGSRSSVSLEWLVEQGQLLDGRRRTKWRAYCDDVETAARATKTTGSLLDALISRIGLDGAAASLDAGRARADRAGKTDDLRALRRTAPLNEEPGDFEPWLRQVLARPSPDSGVVLSTIHRVKGLEWPRILVFGVDRGSMPHALSDDVEEERRVFHVGVTRASERAVILSDRDRPSRFLTELDGTAPITPSSSPDRLQSLQPPPNGVRVAVGRTVTVPGGFTGTVDEVLVTGVLVRLDTGAVMAVPWGERVVADHQKGPLVPGDPDPDPALAERLREWRRETAARLGIPAYIVFNDSTLQALAALRPTTEAGLLDVPGIGPSKLDAYGDDILDIVTD
jgi:DNA helicase-2/ATP-dependent DNA helicase PcrA